MEDVAFAIPLFNLPEKALKDVLREMDFINQVGFSLLSERAKTHVKSLELNTNEIYVHISDVIYLCIWKPKSHDLTMLFYTDEAKGYEARRNDPPVEMKAPESVEVKCFRDDQHKGELYKWKKEGFDMKDWIDHFRQILHYPQIDELIVSTHQFDIESVRMTFNNIKQLSIHSGSNTYDQSVLSTYMPVKRLCFHRDPFEDSKSINKVFSQELDTLHLGAICSEWKQLTSDTLLTINSVEFNIYEYFLPEKEYNKFIKHWINGSNPRMRWMLRHVL